MTSFSSGKVQICEFNPPVSDHFPAVVNTGIILRFSKKSLTISWLVNLTNFSSRSLLYKLF